MRVVNVAGTRPNFVKIAPILRALAAAATRQPSLRLESLLVDTGQHYDEVMSASLFRDLQLPRPDCALQVGSGSHGAQTAAVLTAFEAVVQELRPDVVIVVGDVNSTLACGLAAAKLGIPVAHVEAGLRSFDRRMPEEINRVLTDALADFLFTSEEEANANLLREGVPEEKIFFAGNVMIDTLRWAEPSARSSTVLERLGLAADGYALVTLHRAENVDSRDTLAGLLDALNQLAADLPLVVPAHPRTRARLREFGLLSSLQPVGANGDRPKRGRVSLLEPLSYLDCLRLLGEARLVLTDSGGIQEESTCLGVPCITLRESTERPVTIRMGTSVLAGTDPDSVVRHARQALADGRRCVPAPPLWDGRAAERIVDRLIEQWCIREAPSPRRG